MSTSTLTIGLLGAGRIGKVHAAAIAGTPGARLAAVADALPDAAASLAAAYDSTVASIDEIIGDSDIDAVFITTPTDVHADLIEQAAQRRQGDLLREADRPRRSSACGGASASSPRPRRALMVGFNRRFDPNFVAARARIDAGAIGDVEMVSITSRDPGPPPLEYMARSGGLFRDMTIHDFDMARFLLGEEPVSVIARRLGARRSGDRRRPGDFDSAAVTLRHGERQDRPDLQLAPGELRL